MITNKNGERIITGISEVHLAELEKQNYLKLKTMNNLQTLENEIRSKLPHLMELSAGCEFRFKNEPNYGKGKYVSYDAKSEACIFPVSNTRIFALDMLKLPTLGLL